MVHTNLRTISLMAVSGHKFSDLYWSASIHRMVYSHLNTHKKEIQFSISLKSNGNQINLPWRCSTPLVASISFFTTQLYSPKSCGRIFVMFNLIIDLYLVGNPNKYRAKAFLIHFFPSTSP